MYNKIHDHFKTVLLLLLVMYAAINYHEHKKNNVPVKTEWNTLIDQYETFNTFDRIINYINSVEEENQYFDDSHPII